MADKVCPKCGKKGAIDTLFGWRNMRSQLADGSTKVVSRPQSYCRPCRSTGTTQVQPQPKEHTNAQNEVPSSSHSSESAITSSVKSGVGIRLPVITLPGLSPDSLGNYLASLGLLRVLSRKWPSTRIAWRDDVLRVVEGPPTLDELLDELMRVATNREWTPYGREWKDAQAASSKLALSKNAKATSGMPFALWQAQTEEDLLEGFTAHVVPHGTGRSMNPILGKAGIIGQRDFAKGWERAVDLLAPPKASNPGENETPDKKAAREKSDSESIINEELRKRGELKALLQAAPLSWLEKKLNAASWFSHSNKQYNNGQKAYRDGVLSPWLMVFACEGISFLSGGTSRRLGTRAPGTAAFPFITQASAPSASGLAGREVAELWAPLWSRPMTSAEVGTIFRRGRAELSARAAETPGAFAGAVFRRGVDAGITEFRRFGLGWTTAQDYVEPHFHGAIGALESDASAGVALSLTLERVTALMMQHGFPQDRKVGNRWRFRGLRGPIESALLDLAAKPANPEAGITLLDAIVRALDRIDRNRGFRKGKVRWEPLPIDWLPALFSDERPSSEARLALSVVSAFPAAQPFATYRFGVEWKYGKNFANYTHTDPPPPSWVWGTGDLARVLGAVLSRKLLDQEAIADEPGKSECELLPATATQLQQWFDDEIDEALFAAWLSRLALFDWRRIPKEVRGVAPRDETSVLRVGGELALLGLFQPLVDQRSLKISELSKDDLLAEATGARSTMVSRKLVSQVRTGSWDSAIRLAGSRYSMARAQLATFEVTFATASPDRLVAAFLFTLSDQDRKVLFERWLRPRRRPQRGEAHV